MNVRLDGMDGVDFEEELETIDPGHPRPNRCAMLLAERLGQKAGVGIPGRGENRAETAASCRFLRIERVCCEDVTDAWAPRARQF
jgi:hypothetical protein